MADFFLILFTGDATDVSVHANEDDAKFKYDNTPKCDEGWIISATAHLDELTLAQLTRVYKYVSPQGTELEQDPAKRAQANNQVWDVMQTFAHPPATAPAQQPKETSNEEEQVAGTTQTPAPKAAKPAKVAKPPKAAKAAKANGAKRGAITALKKIMLKNPDIKMDKLETELKNKGFTPSRTTIDSFAADFRNSLRVLKEVGYDVPVPGAGA